MYKTRRVLRKIKIETYNDVIYGDYRSDIIVVVQRRSLVQLCHKKCYYYRNEFQCV